MLTLFIGSENFMKIPINNASVKVMRSFDYCHFEVCLSSDSIISDVEIDELRKEAAKLADKAVEQYKAMKANIELLDSDTWKLDQLKRRAEEAEANPESERTPEQKAIIKKLQDGYYQNRRRYDYDDDFTEPAWDDEDE